MSDSDTRKELLAAQIRIDELTEDLAAARVEIAELARKCAEGWMTDASKMMQEIAQWKAAYRQASESAAKWCDAAYKHEAEIAEKDAEIERLNAEKDDVLSTCGPEIERVKTLYAATRDARRVMRFLRHRDPVWELALGDHPEGTPDSNLMVVRGEVIEEGLPWAMTLDEWERRRGLPDIDEEER